MKQIFFGGFLLSVFLLFGMGTLETALALPPQAGSPEEFNTFPGACPGGCPVNQCCDDENNCVNCRQGGCFARNTQITMADRSTKPIEKIKEGDLVLNPVTGQAAKVIDFTGGPEEIPMIELGYDNSLVHVTVSHVFPTKSGLKQAQQLSLSDEIKGSDGQYRALTTLKRLPLADRQYVWNFSLESDSDSPDAHMILANGVVTGDLSLQLALAKNGAKK